MIPDVEVGRTEGGLDEDTVMKTSFILAKGDLFSIHGLRVPFLLLGTVPCVGGRTLDRKTTRGNNQVKTPFLFLNTLLQRFYEQVNRLHPSFSETSLSQDPPHAGPRSRKWEVWGSKDTYLPRVTREVKESRVFRIDRS